MPITTVVLPWVLTLVLVALGLGTFRLLRGPHDVDRLVALDMIGMLLATVTGLLAIRHRDEAYLDLALVMVLVTFVGVVALSFFIRHRVQARDAETAVQEEAEEEDG